MSSPPLCQKSVEEHEVISSPEEDDESLPLEEDVDEDVEDVSSLEITTTSSLYLHYLQWIDLRDNWFSWACRIVLMDNIFLRAYKLVKWLLIQS